MSSTLRSTSAMFVLGLCVLTMCVEYGNGQLPVLGPAVLTNVASGLIPIPARESSLAVATDILTVYIPGADITDLYAEDTTIANRYQCDNMTVEFEFTFDPLLPLEVTLKVKKSVGDEPKCTIKWGDGEEEEQEFDKATVTVPHEYLAPGIYQPVIVCEDHGTCPNQATDCIVTSDLLDDFHKVFETPVKYLVHEDIQINSYMELSNANCDPEIYWSITSVVNNTFTVYPNFTQPNTSVLRLPQFLLEPGDYIVALEVKFPSLGSNFYVTDYIVLKVILPDLIAHISGGDELDVPHGGLITVDATMSADPADNLTSIVATPLVATWYFAHYEGIPFGWEEYLKDSGKSPILLPAGYTSYTVTQGTEFSLLVESTFFPDGSVAIALFTLTRGSRSSYAVQALRFKSNAVPLKLGCVYNCLRGYKMYNSDRLEMNADILDDSIDVSTLSFQWGMTNWNALFRFAILWHIISSPTGFSTRAFALDIGSIAAGLDYKIVLTVSGGGFATTQVILYRILNPLPYDGTCTLPSTSVVSAKDWLTLNCTGWLGNDNRYGVNLALDTNPILTYVVQQYTAGALVEREPILMTRSRKSHLILKVGMPTTFQTTLFVQIIDVLRNVREITIHLTSLPSFDYTAITPDFDGASRIRAYSSTDYPFDRLQLERMGKSDLMISLVTAVCSNLHLVDLPVWAPPVPRVLSSNAVLDLSPGANEDIGSLEEVMTDAENETIDPATLAIQEMVEGMTGSIIDVVNEDVLDKRKGDKYLTSIVTNCFTNLAARDNFANYQSKINMVQLSDIIGLEALDVPENTTEDLTAQIEATSGEVFYMARAIVNAVVPDNLKEIRPVDNLEIGRMQVDNMLTVLGSTMDLNNSVLSEDERAFLYMRMQKSLALKNAKKKPGAKEAAKAAVANALRVHDKMAVCKTCDNSGSTSTKQLIRNNDASVLERSSSRTETSQFRLDGLVNALGDSANGGAESMSLSAFEFQENVYMFDEDDTSGSVTSNVLRIDARAGGTYVTPGFISFDQVVVTPNASRTSPKDILEPEDASEFSYHKLLYSKNTDYLCVIVEPVQPHNITEYDIYIKFKTAPSILDYNIKFTLTKYDKWQRCVEPWEMRGHVGMVYLAVGVPSYKQEYDYDITSITVGCLTWSESEAKWHTDKCDLEWIPEYNKITCFCREVTDLVFANSFFVAPNTIDFSTVFLKFSPIEQAAVMGAIGTIFLIYFIAIIFLLRLDREDKLKWGITPLRDNYVTDDQYYLIKVYTGMRRGAGTNSRIAFILTGSKTGTGPRELFDGVREEFSTGSILTYFMATSKPLGDLQHIYIWHDNSGDGDMASWYLNKIEVYDIATKSLFVFVAERWLSVSTSVDANIVALDDTQPVRFESRFFSHTRDRLSEGHMWVSIMYRPTLSTFTRVQRASCALVYIFLNMIASAMYFNPDDNYQSAPLIQVGPFRFTGQQLFISLICALITTPAVMLLIFLFKRTKRRARERSCCCPSCCSCSCSCWSRCCCKRKKTDAEIDYDTALKARILSEEVPDFSGGFYLPSWCIVFAWLLVVAGSVVPAFFILLYSMEWGKQKSEEWLTTFLMSVFESMFFVDPIMVVCMALLFALLIRSTKTETSIDVGVVVSNYKASIGEHESKLSSSILLLKTIKWDYLSHLSFPRTVTPPLKGSTLEAAADHHRKHTELTKSLKNIVMNVFFLFIVFSICYNARDDRSYAHFKDLSDQLLQPTNLPWFEKITTPGDLFAWINVTAIPALFPINDINGAALHWYFRRFTTGYNMLRIGPPRLRQMRTTAETCSIPYIGEVDCYGDYGIISEDTAGYCIGWASPPCPTYETVYNYTSLAWNFTSAFDVWGLPILADYKTYGGGGYIAQFDVSQDVSIDIVNELYHSLWLDRQTRAVFFEFTLFCPATNIFIYNVFIVEFPETGGALTFYSIYPLRLYNHVGPSGTFAIICEVLFVIYVVILLVKLCIRFYQLRCKFFHQFWLVYELIMFSVAVVVIAMFAVKLGLVYLTIEKYKEDEKQFVNFAHIVFWDQLMVTFLAILVFMATLRILEVFATTKKVSAVVEIFKACGKDLFWYGLAFIHVLIAFSMFGYLLFGKQLLSYMDMFNTVVTLSLTLIGKSKYTEINDMNPVLANVFFILYIMTVMFFVLTIFMSILGASIDSAVQNTRKDDTEDLLDFMAKSFKRIVSKPTSKKGKRKKKGLLKDLPEFEPLRYQPPEAFQVVEIDEFHDYDKTPPPFSVFIAPKPKSDRQINRVPIPSNRRRKIGPVTTD